MKLAEALIERADLQARIAQVKERMYQNVLVQEGDEPAEDVNELLTEYTGLSENLEDLIKRINKTNAFTEFEGESLAAALAKRDCLKSKIQTLRELSERGVIKMTRYSQAEIKFVRLIDVVRLQNDIDALSKQYRELDVKIQETNWTTDLK